MAAAPGRPERSPGALPGAALAALLLTACQATAGPGPGVPRASAGAGCALRLEISSQGQSSLGTVVATGGGERYTVSSPSRRLAFVCATEVTLSETPNAAQGAVFQGWRRGRRLLRAPRTSLLLNGTETVAALYSRPAPPTPSPSG